MQIIIRLLVNAVAVYVTAALLPGVHLGSTTVTLPGLDLPSNSFVAAIVVAVVLGVINAILKPILIVLTLPITLLTLGLFVLVINAALVMLVSALLPQYFSVDGFLWALLFSIVLGIVNAFLHGLERAI
ncbi:MAG TPA: phage holin family protein [Chloroflexota bacterium]|jgi:putative membrane protein